MLNKNKNKKEALLLRKEELLKELKYYDKRIEDSRSSKSNSSFYDDDSSDSEEFPEFAINSGPSLTELKLQESMLRICLHATQELTNLQILQSEVNVMVEDPVFKGEPPVTESGVWREVTAECRADLVPFSVSFNVHTPDQQFAPISYRNLQAMAIKSAHEKELSMSVLPSLRTPSEAVEVFLSYARAHRSRRCSLARLADRHADRLLMEPRAEGGYSLRCSRLRLVWELQNKRSPLAPFSHRLNFDLDYMEESYIKIVSAAHRQLSNPDLDTDERTRLLTKIIDTCLQAGKHMEENTPGDETADKEIIDKPENPAIKAKDSELMAPPKSVPKKVKAKLKRASEDTSDARKFKKHRSESGGNNNSESVVSVTEGTVKSNLQEHVSKDEKSGRDKNKLKSDPKHKKITKTQTKVKNIGNADDIQKKKAVDNIFSTTKNPNHIQSKEAKKTVNSNTEIHSSKQIKKTNTTKPTENDAKSKKDQENITKLTENDAKANKEQENITITKSVENMMHKPNKNINKQIKDVKNKEKTGKENKCNDIKKSNEIKNIQKAKQNNVIVKAKHLSDRFPIKDDVKKPVNTIKNKNILENPKTTKVHKKEVNNKKIGSQPNKKNDIKSKIPQKRSSTDNLKKNPLRISPRKLQSTLSSTQTSSNSLKNAKTNIPRLLKKPSVKPK